MTPDSGDCASRAVAAQNSDDVRKADHPRAIPEHARVAKRLAAIRKNLNRHGIEIIASAGAAVRNRCGRRLLHDENIKLIVAHACQL
jgi:hypothetical protein